MLPPTQEQLQKRAEELTKQVRDKPDRFAR
jgi:hypothetical protein